MTSTTQEQLTDAELDAILRSGMSGLADIEHRKMHREMETEEAGAKIHARRSAGRITDTLRSEFRVALQASAKAELQSLRHAAEAVALLREVLRLSPAVINDEPFRDRIRSLLARIEASSLSLSANTNAE